MRILYLRHSSELRLYLTCTMLLFAVATLFVGVKMFAVTRLAIIYFHAAKTGELGPMIEYLLEDDVKAASA